MNTRRENVDGRVVGGDRPVRRTRFLVAAAGATALLAALLVVTLVPSVATAATDAGAGPAPASGAALSGAQSSGAALSGAQSSGAALSGAQSSGAARSAATPEPTTTPAPQNDLRPAPGTPTSPPADRPVHPTIADPGDITSGTTRFHGTGTAGHTVRVTGPASTGCSATVRADGSWSCIAAVRSGPQQVFTVQDRTTTSLGSASAPASDVIVPPTITTARPTSGPVSGTGYPGATVSLALSGSSAERTTTVGGDGHWTVLLGGGDGRPVVTASQTASTADGYRSDLRSAASAPVTITVDRTAPTAPRITTPAQGDRLDARSATVSGAGEPRAVLTVYVDRAPVCRVDVPASGRWSCSTAGSILQTGAHRVTATQQDAAGNFSPSSAEVRVSVVGGSASPTGASSAPGATGTTGGSAGTPGTAVGPGHGSSTSGHGTPGSGPASTGSGSGVAGGPGSAGGTTGAGGPGVGPGAHARGLDWSGPAGDWTASTSYDTTVPTIQAAFSWRTVLVATAVAAGFLVLVAGPLALVAGAARGRLRNPFAALLGRNRTHDERRRGDAVLPTWASITVAVLIVGLCTVLGVGVSLEARYVRLAVAVLLGAAVLTTTIVLAARWAAGVERRTIGFRVSPWLVLAALVACGLTRSFDLSPAVIIGAVLVPVGRPELDTAALRLGSAVASGARSATWRSVALLVVATAGWVLHSLTPGTGFWGSFVSEFAITLCVGGLGAVVTTLLPLSGSAGHALLTQSRGRYAAIAAVAVALAAAVYSGPAGTHVSPVVLVVVAVACTAAAVASRLWVAKAADAADAADART